MLSKLKKTYYRSGAFMTLGMLGIAPKEALAQAAGGGTKDFGDIAENITTAIGDVPGLISGASYLAGSLLGVLGIMKIKDHVEQGASVPLKDGVIRLVAGGGLFALPIIFESMLGSIGDEQATVSSAAVKKVQFNVVD